MAKMRVTATSTDEVVRQVRNATGINLQMEDSGGGPGGGCYVLNGRLEDGSWVVASDHDGPCQYSELKDRAAHEQVHGPRGWYVGVYPNETYQYNGKNHDTWQEGEAVHVHVDENAATHELPRVIQEALSGVPPTAKGDAGHKDSRGLLMPENQSGRDDLSDPEGGYDIFGEGR